MQIDIAALVAAGHRADHALNYDVDVHRLSGSLHAAILAGIQAQTLSCYTAFGKGLWVSRAQLAPFVGFGHRLYDPRDPWYVPPAAMVQMPYIAAPITEGVAAGSPAQREFLDAARDMATFLASLCKAMPPRPFDLHIHEHQAEASPLLVATETGLLSTYRSSKGWWIVSNEAAALLPTGEGFDEPDSVWFIDPHDRADHDEVDRLCAEHRQRWPELSADLRLQGG